MMKHRFLAYAAVHNGTACKNAFVEISDNGITVSPFISETHSTEFVPGIMYIINGTLTDSEYMDITSRLKACGSMDEALTFLSNFDSGRVHDSSLPAHYYVFSL